WTSAFCAMVLVGANGSSGSPVSMVPGACPSPTAYPCRPIVARNPSGPRYGAQVLKVELRPCTSTTGRPPACCAAATAPGHSASRADSDATAHHTTARHTTARRDHAGTEPPPAGPTWPAPLHVVHPG